MKRILTLLLLLVFTLSSAQKKTRVAVPKKAGRAVLIKFLDSIGKLNPQPWAEAVSAYPDSVYRSPKALNVTLHEKDFEALKKGAAEGKIEMPLFKRIFPDEFIDASQQQDNFANINFHPFTNDKFDLFAIEIYSSAEECNVYFFNKNREVSRHHIRHRYGLELHHFSDQYGKTVVYYRQNFASGSGIWSWNYDFYKYSGAALIPVLSELGETNLQDPWGIRSYAFKATVKKTNPLILKMTYYTKLPESSKKGIPVKFFSDSTEVRYKWDVNSRQYLADFTKSKLNRNKILAYSVDDTELLFINSNYAALKKTLAGKNKRKQQIVLNYLNAVRNYFADRRKSER